MENRTITGSVLRQHRGTPDADGWIEVPEPGAPRREAEVTPEEEAARDLLRQRAVDYVVQNLFPENEPQAQQFELTERREVNGQFQEVPVQIDFLTVMRGNIEDFINPERVGFEAAARNAEAILIQLHGPEAAQLFRDAGVFAQDTAAGGQERRIGNLPGRQSRSAEGNEQAMRGVLMIQAVRDPNFMAMARNAHVGQIAFHLPLRDNPQFVALVEQAANYRDQVMPARAAQGNRRALAPGGQFVRDNLLGTPDQSNLVIRVDPTSPQVPILYGGLQQALNVDGQRGIIVDRVNEALLDELRLPLGQAPTDRNVLQMIQQVLNAREGLRGVQQAENPLRAIADQIRLIRGNDQIPENIRNIYALVDPDSPEFAQQLRAVIEGSVIAMLTRGMSDTDRADLEARLPNAFAADTIPQADLDVMRQRAQAIGGQTEADQLELHLNALNLLRQHQAAGDLGTYLAGEAPQATAPNTLGTPGRTLEQAQTPENRGIAARNLINAINQNVNANPALLQNPEGPGGLMNQLALMEGPRTVEQTGVRGWFARNLGPLVEIAKNNKGKFATQLIISVAITVGVTALPVAGAMAATIGLAAAAVGLVGAVAGATRAIRNGASGWSVLGGAVLGAATTGAAMGAGVLLPGAGIFAPLVTRFVGDIVTEGLKARIENSAEREVRERINLRVQTYNNNLRARVMRLNQTQVTELAGDLGIAVTDRTQDDLATDIIETRMRLYRQNDQTARTLVRNFTTRLVGHIGQTDYEALGTQLLTRQELTEVNDTLRKAAASAAGLFAAYNGMKIALPLGFRAVEWSNTFRANNSIEKAVEASFDSRGGLSPAQMTRVVSDGHGHNYAYMDLDNNGVEDSVMPLAIKEAGPGHITEVKPDFDKLQLLPAEGQPITEEYVEAYMEARNGVPVEVTSIDDFENASTGLSHEIHTTGGDSIYVFSGDETHATVFLTEDEIIDKIPAATNLTVHGPGGTTITPHNVQYTLETEAGHPVIKASGVIDGLRYDLAERDLVTGAARQTEVTITREVTVGGGTAPAAEALSTGTPEVITSRTINIAQGSTLSGSIGQVGETPYWESQGERSDVLWGRWAKALVFSPSQENMIPYSVDRETAGWAEYLGMSETDVRNLVHNDWAGFQQAVYDADVHNGNTDIVRWVAPGDVYAPGGVPEVAFAGAEPRIQTITDIYRGQLTGNLRDGILGIYGEPFNDEGLVPYAGLGEDEMAWPAVLAAAGIFIPMTKIPGQVVGFENPIWRQGVALAGGGAPTQRPAGGTPPTGGNPPAGTTPTPPVAGTPATAGTPQAQPIPAATPPAVQQTTAPVAQQVAQDDDDGGDGVEDTLEVAEDEDIAPEVVEVNPENTRLNQLEADFRQGHQQYILLGMLNQARADGVVDDGFARLIILDRQGELTTENRRAVEALIERDPLLRAEAIHDPAIQAAARDRGFFTAVEAQQEQVEQHEGPIQRGNLQEVEDAYRAALLLGQVGRAEADRRIRQFMRILSAECTAEDPRNEIIDDVFRRLVNLDTEGLLDERRLVFVLNRIIEIGLRPEDIQDEEVRRMALERVYFVPEEGIQIPPDNGGDEGPTPGGHIPMGEERLTTPEEMAELARLTEDQARQEEAAQQEPEPPIPPQPAAQRQRTLGQQALDVAGNAVIGGARLVGRGLGALQRGRTPNPQPPA